MKCFSPSVPITLNQTLHSCDCYLLMKCLWTPTFLYSLAFSMASCIFMTKLTNVSALWRRKFSRSPRLQYSVITSTGPEDTMTHMNHLTRKRLSSGDYNILSLCLRPDVLANLHRCRLPADWQCSGDDPGDWGSSVQTSGPPSHLSGHSLRTHISISTHLSIIPGRIDIILHIITLPLPVLQHLVPLCVLKVRQCQ